MSYPPKPSSSGNPSGNDRQLSYGVTKDRLYSGSCTCGFSIADKTEADIRGHHKRESPNCRGIHLRIY